MPTDAPPVLVTATPSPESETPDSEPAVPENAVQVPILLYHHIDIPEGSPTAPGYEYFVDPAQFEAQMAYLAENGYTPIDFYTLYEHLDGTAELPSNPVIITFDDGYTDLYENAYPILQEFDFSATFFLITGFVEEELDGYMTWDMVEEMASAGMRFETHSSSHADLRNQSSDFLISEVLDSQQLLAQHIGYTPRFIAYPYGQVDDNVIQFLEQNDFWGGLTAQGGLQVALENRFLWPRLNVPPGIGTEDFEKIVAQGQSLSYQPEAVETTTPSLPLTFTVSLTTTQGMITSPAVLVFDESLSPAWALRTSPGVHFNLQNEQNAVSGDVALAFTPQDDLGSFFLQVRPDAGTPFSRDEVVGVAFWLYTGSEPLAPDDLALVITGSNDFPYWSAVDESIDPDEFEPSFEDTRFELGFNRPISEETWVQVVVYFNDLSYDTDYQFITGLNFVNNIGVNRTFLIDELVLVLREP